MSIMNILYNARINCLKVGMEVSAIAAAVAINPMSVFAAEVEHEVADAVVETPVEAVTEPVTQTAEVMSAPILATGSVDLSDVTNPIIGLVNSVLTAAIPLVAAVGALYCVLLGVKYARAEEPQDREKAKQHLKSAIIGFVLIFVLIVALRIATPILTDWMNANS